MQVCPVSLHAHFLLIYFEYFAAIEEDSSDSDDAENRHSSLASRFGSLKSEVKCIALELEKLEMDFEAHANGEEEAQRGFIKELLKSRRLNRATVQELQAGYDRLSEEVEALKAALQAAGIPLPGATQPASASASTSTIPPIVLTPSTPQNSQEAERYGQLPLKAPSQGSIPPIDGEKMDVDGNAAEAVTSKLSELAMETDTDEARGQMGSQEEAPRQGPEEQQAGEPKDAGEIDKPGEPKDAGQVTETGQLDDAVDEQAEPIAPASTPTPSLPLPRSSPPPARRSPRLLTPVAASPRAKQPHSDEQGSDRGSSKRSKH